MERRAEGGASGGGADGGLWCALEGVEEEVARTNGQMMLDGGWRFGQGECQVGLGIFLGVCSISRSAIR